MNSEMDGKKRLRRIKESNSAETVQKTPQKAPSKNNEASGNDFVDAWGSPDFPSSQECFSVGWDWSGQIHKSNRPIIRVVERPAPKRKESGELLKCHRQRHIVRKYNPEMFDASSFVDELKSLASGFKHVPESNSPVASPPHSSLRRRGDHLVTPTSLKEHPKESSSSSVGENVTASTSAAPTTYRENSRNIPSGQDSLNDLLDDSLGADLLKCTQDCERDLKYNEDKTPNPEEKGLHCLSNSKKKSRLSLSSKKDSNTRKGVCRRINDVYEKSLCTIGAVENKDKSTGFANCRGKNEENPNNNNILSNIEFDDLDEATLLTITNEIEEKEMIRAGETSSSSKENYPNMEPNVDTVSTGTNLTNTDYDDEDFVSPDLLDMIDQWEKKAAQDPAVDSKLNQPAMSNVSSCDKTVSKPSVSACQNNGQNVKSIKNPEGEKKAENNTHHQLSHKTTSSSSGGSFKCTPEEIEKKRQNAIRKRLQLKKKY